jgi:hypothetical protein
MKYLLGLGLLASAPLLWACSNDSSTGGTGGCGVGWGPSAGGGQAQGVSTSSGSGPTTSGAGPTTSGAGPSTTGAGTGTGPSTSGAGGAAQATSAAGTGGAGGGACSGAGGIYDTPEVCTSNVTWTVGNDATMRPGEACQTCHVLLGQATGETFDVSGTVYPTAHEPNDCDGTDGTGSLNVVITDATGAATTLPVNAVGNFYHDDLFGFAALKTPLKAKVVSNAGTREMVSSVTTGNCNSCHTEAGTMSAPGRVMAP